MGARNDLLSPPRKQLVFSEPPSLKEAYNACKASRRFSSVYRYCKPRYHLWSPTARFALRRGWLPDRSSSECCDTMSSRTGSSRPDQPCDRVIQVWLLKELMKYGLHNVLRRERRPVTKPGRDLPGLRDRKIDSTRPPFACAEPATAVP